MPPGPASWLPAPGAARPGCVSLALLGASRAPACTWHSVVAFADRAAAARNGAGVQLTLRAHTCLHRCPPAGEPRLVTPGCVVLLPAWPPPGRHL